MLREILRSKRIGVMDVALLGVVVFHRGWDRDQQSGIRGSWAAGCLACLGRLDKIAIDLDRPAAALGGGVPRLAAAG